MIKAADIVITGRVQGVSFRDYTARAARALDLTGHVENLPDERVFAHVEGEPEALARFIDWCHIGSPLAKVAQVDVSPAAVIDAEDFAIRGL